MTKFGLRLTSISGAMLASLLLHPAPAAAQLDPLLFLKGSAPNILVAVDVSHRMQRDAPSDPANPKTTSSYYDPFLYPKQSSAQETEIGLTNGNTSARYRRKYVGLDYISNVNGDKFQTTTITGTGDLDPNYANFEAATRLSIARA